MDYITVIATRSIILFPGQKPIHKHSTSASSCLNTPTTAITPPTPISMPIQSLMYDVNECAHFLLHHLLTSSSLGAVGKDVSAEAEVMVWKEIDRATLFVRGIGEWFAAAKHAKIREKDLRRIAGKYGVRSKEVKEDERDGEHGVESLKGERVTKGSISDGIIIAA